jgi:hypothetical protein
MNKAIRDGKVAVIFSPGYGAGWYTWHGKQELLYDCVVVEMIENRVGPQLIVDYCELTYGSANHYGGAEQLAVVWLDEGTQFIISEYDGSETVQYKDDVRWLTA